MPDEALRVLHIMEEEEVANCPSPTCEGCTLNCLPKNQSGTIRPYPLANLGLKAEPRYPECPDWLLKWAIVTAGLVIVLPMIAHLINR